MVFMFIQVNNMNKHFHLNPNLYKEKNSGSVPVHLQIYGEFSLEITAFWLFFL